MAAELVQRLQVHPGWLASATPRAVVAQRPGLLTDGLRGRERVSATATPSATWVDAGTRPKRTITRYAAAAPAPSGCPRAP